jgi:hypothetical protein
LVASILTSARTPSDPQLVDDIEEEEELDDDVPEEAGEVRVCACVLDQ